MKTTLKVNGSLLFALVTIFTCFIACSSDDDNDQDNNNDNTQEIMEANSIATSGDWFISNYTDDGENETSDYAGYTFTFNENGSLFASNGTTELTGSWSIEDDDDDSSDDDDDDDIDFNINFSVSDDHDFDDLSDDWDILNMNATTISLRDVSGGDGSIDLLTFSKN